MYNYRLLCLIALVCLASCAGNSSSAEKETATTEKKDSLPAAVTLSLPEWALQSNIYEVNVRQYTKEGTFNAFAAALPRLQQMGVQILWFMPITPISQADRKGKLGSYYAVQNYTAVNPEFGTMDDWKALVKKAHEMGFKVITDWVPNHTGADTWMAYTGIPIFLPKTADGKPIPAFDWSDTRDLELLITGKCATV